MLHALSKQRHGLHVPFLNHDLDSADVVVVYDAQAEHCTDVVSYCRPKVCTACILDALAACGCFASQ